MTREHVITEAGGTMDTMWYRCSCGVESGVMALDNGDQEPRALGPWRVGHAAAMDEISQRLDGYNLALISGLMKIVDNVKGAYGCRGVSSSPSLRWYVAGFTDEQREDAAVGCDALLRSAPHSDLHDFARELLVMIGVLTRSPDDE